MPTHEELERFRHEYRRLSRDQRAQFRTALRRFRDALQAWELRGMRGPPEFPAGLRVKAFYAEECWELTWAADGRALWNYGAKRREGRCHIVWLRVGSHEIFEEG